MFLLSTGLPLHLSLQILGHPAASDKLRVGNPYSNIYRDDPLPYPPISSLPQQAANSMMSLLDLGLFVFVVSRRC